MACVFFCIDWGWPASNAMGSIWTCRTSRRRSSPWAIRPTVSPASTATTSPSSRSIHAQFLSFSSFTLPLMSLSHSLVCARTRLFLEWTFIICCLLFIVYCWPRDRNSSRSTTPSTSSCTICGSERSYAPAKFEDRVARFPFDDHNPSRFDVTAASSSPSSSPPAPFSPCSLLSPPPFPLLFLFVFAPFLPSLPSAAVFVMLAHLVILWAVVILDYRGVLSFSACLADCFGTPSPLSLLRLLSAAFTIIIMMMCAVFSNLSLRFRPPPLPPGPPSVMTGTHLRSPRMSRLSIAKPARDARGT